MTSLPTAIIGAIVFLAAYYTFAVLAEREAVRYLDDESGLP